jgi:hypothetical protein
LQQVERISALTAWLTRATRIISAHWNGLKFWAVQQAQRHQQVMKSILQLGDHKTPSCQD